MSHEQKNTCVFLLLALPSYAWLLTDILLPFILLYSTKNRLAMNVISHLIASCRWSNIHVVPQHGAVFEIRVADGYGARWSMDGTKVYICYCSAPFNFMSPCMYGYHARKQNKNVFR